MFFVVNCMIMDVSLWLIFALCIKFFIHLIFFDGNVWLFFIDGVILGAVKHIEMLLVKNDFLTISSGISLQDCFILCRTRCLDGTFFLSSGVNLKRPVIIHNSYFLLMFSLKGLFRHLSNGWRTGVRPLAITSTSIFCCCNASLTVSVR